MDKKVLQEQPHGYPVFVGHIWSADLVQVLFDEFAPFTDHGYDFDSLANFFIGGRGGWQENRLSKPKNQVNFS